MHRLTFNKNDAYTSTDEGPQSLKASIISTITNYSKRKVFVPYKIYFPI